MNKQTLSKIGFLLLIIIIISICSVSKITKFESFTDVDLGVLIQKCKNQTEKYKEIQEQLKKVDDIINN